MSLKRENKLKKEYQKYYESEPKGKALSYYQWKEAMYPDEMLDKRKKVNKAPLKRVKERMGTVRESLEGALTPEEIKRLGGR